MNTADLEDRFTFYAGPNTAESAAPGAATDRFTFYAAHPRELEGVSRFTPEADV
jgi:hypothetical protein